MRPILQEIYTSHAPETLTEQLFGVPGVVLLRTLQLIRLPHAIRCWRQIRF